MSLVLCYYALIKVVVYNENFGLIGKHNWINFFQIIYYNFQLIQLQTMHVYCFNLPKGAKCIVLILCQIHTQSVV